MPLHAMLPGLILKQAASSEEDGDLRAAGEMCAAGAGRIPGSSAREMGKKGEETVVQNRLVRCMCTIYKYMYVCNVI